MLRKNTIGTPELELARGLGNLSRLIDKSIQERMNGGIPARDFFDDIDLDLSNDDALPGQGLDRFAIIRRLLSSEDIVFLSRELPGYIPLVFERRRAILIDYADNIERDLFRLRAKRRELARAVDHWDFVTTGALWMETTGLIMQFRALAMLHGRGLNLSGHLSAVTAQLEEVMLSVQAELVAH